MKVLIALLFTLVFALGGLGGWLLRGQPPAMPVPQTQPPENTWSTDTLENYRKELALTDDQLTALKPVMRATALTIRGIRQRVAGEIRDAIRANSAGVRKVLTTEQMPPFEALIEKRRREIEPAEEDPIHAPP